jgi:hypothetical protein
MAAIKKYNSCRGKGSFAAPLLLLHAILNVLAILAVVVNVEAAATCTRCKKRYTRNRFRNGPCTSKEGGGGFVRTPDPESPNPCECTEQPILPPYTCSLQPHASSSEDACSCRSTFSNYCPAGKCDYSFQCGTTLYVCWNLISPVDLGVCLDKDCSSTTATTTSTIDATVPPRKKDQIQSIEYCSDPWDNDLSGVGIDCGQLCSLDPIVLDTVPDQIIGTELCPDGQAVQRYTKFCAPDGANGSGNFNDCLYAPQEEENEENIFGPPPSVVAGCEMPFCDFGNNDRPFRLTLFPDPITTSNQDTEATTTTLDQDTDLLEDTMLVENLTIILSNPSSPPTTIKKDKKAKPNKVQPTNAKKGKTKNNAPTTTTQTTIAENKKGKDKTQKRRKQGLGQTKNRFVHQRQLLRSSNTHQ